MDLLLAPVSMAVCITDDVTVDEGVRASPDPMGAVIASGSDCTDSSPMVVSWVVVISIMRFASGAASGYGAAVSGGVSLSTARSASMLG